VTTTSDECTTAAKWGTRTSESTATGAVYNSLTANYSAAAKVFGIWTNTVATPFAVTWSSMLAGATNTAPSAPTDLFVNEQVNGAQTAAANPVAVGDATPVFSSRFIDVDDANTSVVAEINVYTDDQCTTTPVWESGNISITSCTEGNQCEDQLYGGTALEFNGTTYYWKMRYTDQDSAVGTFSACNNFTILVPDDQTRNGNYFFNDETESKFTW